jgi:hypothetical protein
MNFPFVEYARQIDLNNRWGYFDKLEVKFVKDGEEQMISFDFAELTTVKKLGQHRRKVVEMEESMRHMMKSIQAMRDEIDTGTEV